MAVVSKLASSRFLGFYALQLLCLTAAVRILNAVLCRRRAGSGSTKHRSHRSSSSYVSGSDDEDTIRMNRIFWERLGSLLRVCIPRFVSLEFGSVLLMLTLFYLRTRLTLLFARVVGRSGRFLVEHNKKAFCFCVADIGLLAIPGTILQVGLKYVKIMTQQRLRDNLQAALHKEYLKGTTVYMISTQNATIDNTDHRLTQETDQFCRSVAGVFRALFKPILDVVTLSIELSKHGGPSPPAFLISYYLFIATCMSVLLPNFAQLVATSQQKEGNLRTKHHQLISHAEEIAFYNGEEIECEHVGRLLRSLIRHEYKIKRTKWLTGCSDSLFIKYGASIVGYLLCSLVVVDQCHLMSKGELTQLYLQSVQLYVPFSEAIGQILLMHKQLGALCGSVHRIGELRERLERINALNVRSEMDNVVYSDDLVQWAHVDIVSPAGVSVLRDFNLTVTPGRHTLIMGSNGSGKTALMRVLSGLWPLAKGRVTLPTAPESFMCLPQRTYLPPGSLRAVLTYPYVTEDTCNGKSEQAFVPDEVIMSAATSFGLSTMMDREGGLNASENWEEVLSGGERQRVALVRVLLHRPKFAFLDECTSAISQDEEPFFYSLLQKAGVTLISVSHREALRKLHRVVIFLDGEGGYQVSEE
ncbi:putative ABC transporter transmembrane region 2/ABC transporter [Leishmania naiffi]|uniref:ABC transporter transmembrane region 2/ABC transporter n=1 Tax=Leishmania naiffi TaxID=5678 RepID=A0AAW3B9E5_9TRYP